MRGDADREARTVARPSGLCHRAARRTGRASRLRTRRPSLRPEARPRNRAAPVPASPWPRVAVRAPALPDRPALPPRRLSLRSPALRRRNRAARPSPVPSMPFQNLRRTAPHPAPWRPHAVYALRRVGGPAASKASARPASVSFEPGVERQFGEVTFLAQSAEDGADLADDQLKHGDLLLEQRQQLILQRSARDEVEHEDLPMLADAVDTANALLDRHRIPGHIEVDRAYCRTEYCGPRRRIPCRAAPERLSRKSAIAASFCGPLRLPSKRAKAQTGDARADRPGGPASPGNGRRPAFSRPGCDEAGRAALSPCRRSRSRPSVRPGHATPCRRGGAPRTAPPRPPPRQATIQRRRTGGAAPAGALPPRSPAARRRAAAARSA